MELKQFNLLPEEIQLESNFYTFKGIWAKGSHTIVCILGSLRNNAELNFDYLMKSVSCRGLTVLILKVLRDLSNQTTSNAHNIYNFCFTFSLLIFSHIYLYTNLLILNVNVNIYRFPPPTTTC